MPTNSPIQRAPFSPELTPLREELSSLIPLLEKKPDWYGSVYFERKSTQRFSVDLKKTDVSDSITMGAVLRIYDGNTLFEQATDDLHIDSLKAEASKLVERAENNAHPTSESKPYTPPKWAQRLQPENGKPLDSEITDQIPSDVNASTPVHFGIRYDQDPASLSSQDYLELLKKTLDRVKSLASKNGLDEKEITFAKAAAVFSQDESIFIDRESNLSQNLYRMALTSIVMSGPERVYARVGGLGGLETIDLPDSEIEKMLKNLKALKKADRLTPGKYKVLFAPSLTGVLAHEAFGHSQEGDTCARGRSKAWDLYHSGEIVGNEHATILNNPAIFRNADTNYAAWGSYFFDEEGWLSQEQVLLDKGKLCAPMTNLTSAIRLNVPRTANGKRENWSHGVYTRQTNTYFSAGDKTREELLSEIEDGFYAEATAGGMEDPKGMGIQVGISFLEEVKNGKPTGKVLKGPAGGDIQLTGYTPDVLHSIVGKSKIEAENPDKDTAVHPMNDVGGCGKYHKEIVNAGCGGTYLLLENVTLG